MGSFRGVPEMRHVSSAGPERPVAPREPRRLKRRESIGTKLLGSRRKWPSTIRSPWVGGGLGRKKYSLDSQKPGARVHLCRHADRRRAPRNAQSEEVVGPDSGNLITQVGALPRKRGRGLPFMVLLVHHSPGPGGNLAHAGGSTKRIPSSFSAASV